MYIYIHINTIDTKYDRLLNEKVPINFTFIMLTLKYNI